MKKTNFIFGILFTIMSLMTSCTDTIEVSQPEESNANYSLAGSPLHFFHSQKFRGFNINPWISEAEFEEIVEKTGANILRVSFTGGAKLMSKTPSNGAGSTAEYEFNDGAFEALDRILNWAKNHNIKIIIDPHTAPGFESDFTTSATDAFWHDPEWHNHLIHLWERIIDEVNKPEYENVIAGYDLLNEPEIPDPLLCQYGNQWNTLVATLVNTIRSKGDQHPIIIQPAGIAIGLNCNGGGGTAQIVSRWRALNLLCLPDDSNLVVSSHFYDPLFFTHQGVGNLNIPIGTRYPGSIANFPNILYTPPIEYWDQNRIDTELDYLRNFSTQHPNVPILIGEFSVARAAGCDGDVFLKHFLEMTENEGWNWIYHAWDRQEPNFPAPWHPGYSYTSPLSNNANTESLETAPRINLLRQYMYKNLNNFPPTNQMIYGLYRLSHTNGEQLLTYNLSEVSTAVFNYGYKIDGVFGRVAKNSNSQVVTVYKLRNPNSGNRLFTTSETEKNSAINTYGYADEGVGFYASSININNSYIPVYRLQKGAFYRYAMSVVEKDYLSSSPGGNWLVELNGLPAFYLQPSQMY